MGDHSSPFRLNIFIITSTDIFLPIANRPCPQLPECRPPRPELLAPAESPPEKQHEARERECEGGPEPPDPGDLDLAMMREGAEEACA